MKNDLTQTTIDTYDRSAEAFAQHFQNYADGVAKDEIDKTLGFLENPTQARVIEIGCGTGKDAADIVERVGWYEGFDPSEKLLAVAKQHVPTASFVQADATSYTYPSDVDAVFAFASLLHVDRDDLATVFEKIATALKPGGVVCMTLKEAAAYTEELQEDNFGKRQFYLYSPQLVCELAGPAFEKVFEDHQVVGPKQKPWFTIILRRV